MTYSLLTGLVLFCFVSSITPGPNNLMLMATGANFGARRAAPHASGIVLGFTFMIVAIGLGVAQLFQIYPLAHQLLGVVSVIYLIYLAYKTATARTNLDSPEPTGKPITFWQAAAFQWVNPKAWTMALAAVTVYAPQPVTYKEVIVVATIFGAINLPCISVWLMLGVKMRRFLTTPARLRGFNWTMAGLLILSLAPIAAFN
ncbi:Cysteine/O-acetylserine efflux protein [Rhodobacteraceae bacterium IMCC1933]|jgi:threonine/homoserine/homoserine lactone efflux protein|nr:LysE family translocator [Paracoccaceae bacterium]MDP4065077.1 Cysteine/O-acetylserine efflux protein [Rhodobacteraceae bacterium IMCC1923]MDP4068186.1 Cysteine/O-acetylserine efflux protein [Rhodobacteraceae bacterium IMCC1933]MDP4070122.1 Cysteine/O-acetylserine efflux protein [Rhodobacteraceae bacterium IMCC1909]